MLVPTQKDFHMAWDAWSRNIAHSRMRYDVESMGRKRNADVIE